jgi:hypothetical protein
VRLPRWIAALGVALAVLGCRSHWIVFPGPVDPLDCDDSAEVTHSVFLIGDAGDPKLPEGDPTRLVDPVLANLRSDVVARVGELGVDHVAVVYLGDNVYPKGLVHPYDAGRERGERILEAQIAAAGPAWVVFTAGNHDWEREGPRGWEHIVEQRKYLASKGPRVAMLPSGGCAGPNRVDFGPYLRFVFLDQVGWLHAARFPDQHRPVCPHQTALEIFFALADEFDHPDGRHVVLAAHHPLITAGPHGGHFRWQEHLFPLQEFVPWLWIPLPVIGSIYPISRQLGVTGTDVTSTPYQHYLRAIYRASRPRVPMMITAGHEHSLQVHRDAVGVYYAVSGAGSASKVNRVEEMPSLMMALADPGYMRLDAHADGHLGLTVLALSDGAQREPVFRHCLAHGPPEARQR